MYNAVMVVPIKYACIPCDLHRGLIHRKSTGPKESPPTYSGQGQSDSPLRSIPTRVHGKPFHTCGIHCGAIVSAPDSSTKKVRFAPYSRLGARRLIITSKSDYGLRAVLYLASRPERVRLREISESQHIPESICAQIMRKLVGAQIVESQAGPAGGYVLARAPESISVASILAASDRDICVFRCVEDGCDCDLDGKCAFQLVLKGFGKSIADYLQQLSLAELRDRQASLNGFNLPAMATMAHGKG
jgi:Rrf2 family protein